MQSDNKGDSLTDNLWAEMSLMMVLVVIYWPLRGDTSGNSHSSLSVVRQCGKLRDALLNSRAPLLSIRIGKKHVNVLV